MKAEAFPSFISKTDETRIQNMPFVLSGNDIFECREKLDGSSMTVFAIKKQVGFFRKREEIEIGVCSRNRRLIRGTKNSEKFFKAFDKYNMEEAMYELVRFQDWVAIQGELIGPGIQKNKYNLEDVDFYAFNYIRSTGQLPSVVGESTMWSYGIKWVPYVGTIEMPCSVDDVLKFATAPSIINPDTLREGIVCRNSGKNISFKAVSPDFLLRYDL